MTLAALLLATTARADATDDAREFTKRAFHSYNKQEWEDALDRFQAAYDAVPEPTLLFNIGQCQRQLGRYAAAAHSYRAYLAQVPDGGDREAAERFAAQMDAAELARQRPAPVPPIAAPSAPPAAVIAAPAPPRRPRLLAAGLGIAGAGLALAVAGAVLLDVGVRDDGDARRALTLPEQHRLWDAGGQLQTAGIATLAAGGAALIVGGILAGRRR